MERRLRIKIGPKQAGKTVEQVLKTEAGLSRRQISRLKFQEGGIRASNRQVRVTHVLTEGEILEILLEEAEEGSVHLKRGEGNLSILYEDEDLAAVNKPAGLVVHPSPGHYRDSLANQLVAYYRDQGQEVRVRSIGRLDKDTSGVLLFGKHGVSAAKLCRQREEQIYQRWYLALAWGKFRKKTGKLTGKIGPCPGEKKKMAVTVDGKTAVTHYQVLYQAEGYALLACRLETGRTHQIRVHMAHAGHPLLGDLIYGKGDSCPRLMLHAWKVRCVQPFTGEALEICAPVPREMEELCREWMNQQQ